MSYVTLQFGLHYHLYNKGNNREALFKEDRNYYYFIELYRRYIYPISDLYAYCFLPTHFHFLLRFKDIKELNDIYQEDDQLWKQMRNYLGTYTKTINNTYHRTGHLFQGRYSRKIVPNDEYFFRLIVYIHQNPQNHGIVSDFRSWPYSSYNAYENQNERSIVSKKIFSDLDLYNTIMEMHNTSSLIELEKHHV